MALLRWIHQRKLVAIEDLIQAAGSGGGLSLPRPGAAGGVPQAASRPGGLPSAGSGPASSGPTRSFNQGPVPQSTAPKAGPPPAPARPTIGSSSARAENAPAVSRPAAASSGRVLGPDEMSSIPAAGGLGGSALKDAVLGEARASQKMLYNTLLVQAQKIEVLGERLILTFAASFKYGVPFEKYRSTLEGIATKLAGRKITVEADGSGADAQAADSPAGGAPKPSPQEQQRQAALKEQALADTGVQALLEVFPAEIRDVEEM